MWGIFQDALRRKLDTGSARLTDAELQERIRSGAYGDLHAIDPMRREALAFERGERLQNTRFTEVYDGGIAVITISGPIYRRASSMEMSSGAMSTEAIARDLIVTRQSANVNAIILDMDTPGGEASGMDELAQKIFETRQIRPIEGYAEGLCASAGYYIVSPTQKITVGQMGLIGSIGVVMGIPAPDAKTAQGDNIHVDPDGSIIVEFVSSQSPKKRVDPTTKPGHEYFQNIVNLTADVFVKDVARFRGLTADQVPEQYGEGGVAVGQQALSMGLCDAVGSFESVLQRMQSAYGKASSSKVTVTVPSDDPAEGEDAETLSDGGTDMGLLDRFRKPAAATEGQSAATTPTQEPGKGPMTISEMLAELNKQRPAIETRFEDKAALRAANLVTDRRILPAIQVVVGYEYLTACVDDALYGGTILFPVEGDDDVEVEKKGTRVEQFEAKYANMPRHSYGEDAVRSLREGQVQGSILTQGKTESAPGYREAGEQGVEKYSDDELLKSSTAGEQTLRARSNGNRRGVN